MILLEDGTEHVVAGAVMPGFVDHGLRHTYGSELRTEWGEVEVHRVEDHLRLRVAQVLAGCGDLSRTWLSFWRSHDGGRTWAPDERPIVLSSETAVATATTHP